MSRSAPAQESSSTPWALTRRRRSSAGAAGGGGGGGVPAAAAYTGCAGADQPATGATVGTGGVVGAAGAAAGAVEGASAVAVEASHADQPRYRWRRRRPSPPRWPPASSRSRSSITQDRCQASARRVDSSISGRRWAPVFGGGADEPDS